MSDISIPGVSSKYGTTEMVEKLVEAEKLNLTSMEEEVEDFKTDKENWQGINRYISSLQTSSKTLYGFENPFNEKKTNSSDESSVTLDADRNADLDEIRLKVNQKASGDKFISASIENDIHMEAGEYSFKIGDDEVRLKYRGGTLKDFVKRMNAKGDGLLNLSLIKQTSDSQIMVVESLKTGKENKLEFTGDSLAWAIDTGILKQADVEKGELSVISDSLTTKSLFMFPPSARVMDNGVLTGPGTESHFTVSAPPAASLSVKFTISGEDLDFDSYTPPTITPPSPPLPPGVEYEHIQLSSLAPDIPFPEDKAPEKPELIETVPQLQVNGNIIDTGNWDGISLKEITLPPDDSETVPASPEITLKNGNTYRNITLSGFRYFDPEQSSEWIPANPVSEASDAVLEYNGIKVTRDTNHIDDLVDGITINIKKETDGEVTLSVEPDTEQAKDAIIKFVYQYNQLMTDILILSNDNEEIVNEIEYFDDEERDAAMERLGSFRGDLTLMQLKSRLQTIIADAYETSAGDELTLLAQIGISTNATGSAGGSYNAAKLRGYIEIDEEKLDSSLETMLPAIKELFGIDSDNDLIIDSGIAYRMDNFLTPYSQTGGLLQTKISRIDSQIKSKEDDIDDYKIHLEDYELELREKYGKMESAMNELEASSQTFDNFNNSKK